MKILYLFASLIKRKNVKSDGGRLNYHKNKFWTSFSIPESNYFDNGVKRYIKQNIDILK